MGVGEEGKRKKREKVKRHEARGAGLGRMRLGSLLDQKNTRGQLLIEDQRSAEGFTWRGWEGKR